MLKANNKMFKLQEKIGKVFSTIPISPNQWTLLSFFTALISAYFIFNSQFLYAALVFAIAVLMDAIDGAVARATGKSTNFGAFLDGIIDRLVESTVLIAFLFVELPERLFYVAFVLLLIFGTYMTSFIRAYAHHRGVIDKNDILKMGGFFERAERCILLFLILIAANFNILWAIYLAYFGAALSLITVLQRFFYIYMKNN